MRLAAAAKHFDQQVLTDAYGSATIRGQFDLFDDSKRDGVVSRRRILSVAPGTTLPARNVLGINGATWLVGSANTDYFKASAIRDKYVLHEADGLATVQSFAQFLAGAGGTTAYAALEWTKAAKEVDESSDLSDVMTAVLARTETLPAVGVLTLGSGNYLLREPHQSAAGFLMVLVDEIKAPAKETGTFTGMTYEPVTDVWAGTGVSVAFVRLRWQSHFRYLSASTLRYEAGDDVLICLKSAATPKANDKVVLADGTWQVLTVQAEDTLCWRVHARRVPG